MSIFRRQTGHFVTFNEHTPYIDILLHGVTKVFFLLSMVSRESNLGQNSKTIISGSSNSH